jgi:hypothetical protein
VELIEKVRGDADGEEEGQQRGEQPQTALIEKWRMVEALY